MRKLKTMMNRFDRVMAAVTFAEAGEPDTALHFLSQKPRRKDFDRKKAVKRDQDRNRPVLRV